jgi:alpha-tubulin suppressor-like RCC1 family protein/predicted peptidase
MNPVKNLPVFMGISILLLSACGGGAGESGGSFSLGDSSTPVTQSSVVTTTSSSRGAASSSPRISSTSSNSQTGTVNSQTSSAVQFFSSQSSASSTNQGAQNSSVLVVSSSSVASSSVLFSSSSHQASSQGSSKSSAGLSSSSSTGISSSTNSVSSISSQSSRTSSSFSSAGTSSSLASVSSSSSSRSSTASSVSSTSSSVSNTPASRQQQKFLMHTRSGVQTRVRFLEYLPENYASSSEKYPLLVFAHGAGESSQNDSSTADAVEYARIAVNGPPMLIKQNQNMCFTVNGKRSCFIVISPQSPKGDGWWAVDRLRAVLDYAKANLRVDTSRIYMTGLSMGGGITWAFARSTRTNPVQYYAAELAAIVPIAGADEASSAACNMATEALPVWAFHGDADPQVSIKRSREFVSAINGLPTTVDVTPAKQVQCTTNPQKALLTEYPGVQHNSWTQTYNPANRFNPVTAQPDASGVNIYEWMLNHVRDNTNLLPASERMLSAGTYYSLGVSTGGVAYTWGSNRAGELGIGSNDAGITKTTPFNMGLADEIVAMSAGGYQGLALNRGGRVWSFGSNEAGQRGDGSAETNSNGTPVLLNDLKHIITISSGGRHNLALTADGKVYAWGSDDNGQVGRGQAVQTTACNVSVYGTATSLHVRSPYVVSLPVKIKSISAGYCASYALDENGEVWSWGFGDYQAANLGQGVKSDQAISTPAKVKNLVNIKAIAGGEACAYALNMSGQVWAWGVNRLGCVGDGSQSVRATPVLLNLSNVRMIAARSQGAYAITNQGELWSWGESMYGSVGNGTWANKPKVVDTDNSDRKYVLSPVPVTALTNVRGIYSGSPANHVFAVLADGSLWTWGRNKSGNLGNGKQGDVSGTNTTPDVENVPTPIPLNF